MVSHIQTLMEPFVLSNFWWLSTTRSFLVAQSLFSQAWIWQRFWYLEQRANHWLEWLSVAEGARDQLGPCCLNSGCLSSPRLDHTGLAGIWNNTLSFQRIEAVWFLSFQQARKIIRDPRQEFIGCETCSARSASLTQKFGAVVCRRVPAPVLSQLGWPTTLLYSFWCYDKLNLRLSWSGGTKRLKP